MFCCYFRAKNKCACMTFEILWCGGIIIIHFSWKLFCVCSLCFQWQQCYGKHKESHTLFFVCNKNVYILMNVRREWWLTRAIPRFCALSDGMIIAFSRETTCTFRDTQQFTLDGLQFQVMNWHPHWEICQTYQDLHKSTSVWERKRWE